MIKSVSIFGGSSETGVCAVNAAIEKGLNVRVLLDCRAERPKGWEASVEVVEGSVLDIQRVKATLEGQDAVVVVLGSNTQQDFSCVTCEGLKNIVAVMELLYIKVISVCFPTQTMNQSDQSSTRVSPEYKSQMSKVVESSSLHWVVVDVPWIVDGVATGYSVVRNHQSSASYTTVSRQDLAAFLIDCLSMPERFQKTVKIASFVRR